MSVPIELITFYGSKKQDFILFSLTYYFVTECTFFLHLQKRRTSISLFVVDECYMNVFFFSLPSLPVRNVEK